MSTYARRYNEGVACVLPELLVGLDRKNPRCRIPDQLVNADHARRAGFPLGGRRVDVRVPELDEERVLAVYAGRIDIAIERDGHAWL